MAADGRRGAPPIASSHAPQTNGTLRPRRSRGSPSGTMTWGRVDRRGRRPRPARGPSSPPAATLVDTAHGYADGASEELARHASRRARPPRRGRGLHQGRHLPAHRRARRRHLAAGAAAASSTRRWRASAPTTSTSGWSTPGATRPRSRRRSRRLEWAVTSGRARYVGVSNYSGWQSAHAATLHARGGRVPLVANEVEYSLLNRDGRGRGAPARRARSGSGCCRGPRWARGAHRASTATACRPTRGRRPASTRASPRATWTTTRAQVVDAVAIAAQRPRGVSRRGGAGLGARPAGRRRTDRRARAPRPSCGTALASEDARAAGRAGVGAGRGLGLSRSADGAASEPAGVSSESTRSSSPRSSASSPSSASYSSSSRPEVDAVVVLVVGVVELVVLVAVVVVVVVVVVLVVVTAVDLERGDLAVGLEQRLVVGLEGVGDVLVGGDDRGVVLAAAGAAASRWRSRAATRWPVRHADRRSWCRP